MSKVALVTGSSRGIGRAIAVELAKLKYKIIINYRKRLNAAEETLKLVKDAGGEGIIIRADVSKENEVKEMFHKIREAYGGIDILVNNAGWGLISLLEQMDSKLWERHIAVNLSSAFYCSREAIPYMLKNKWGRIINITSIAGIRGIAGLVAYSTAKAGLIGFTKALAQELAGTGITVNAIAIGFAKTDMGFSFFKATGISIEEFKRKFTLTGDLVEPFEVASLVAYLASDKAKNITGQVFVIDSGQSLAPSALSLFSSQ